MATTILRAAAAWTAREETVVLPAELHAAEGRIAWIGRQGDGPAPEAASVIDLGGHWLLPGFVDAHLHLWGLDIVVHGSRLERAVGRLIRGGIPSVGRGMAGACRSR